MAHGGLAVIATGGGGLSEQVVHGKTGLLVSPGDSLSMAEAMRRLILDPATANRMGRAGHHHLKSIGTLSLLRSEFAALLLN